MDESMAERKYSVSEIDQMRRSVTVMLGGYRASAATVEDHLRTYMINGTSPEELAEAAHTATERAWERHCQADKM